MKKHQQTVGKSDEWLTPKNIIDSLGLFDLDPCAAVNRPFDCATVNYTVLDDGFNQEWFGRIWLNPPFNRYQKGAWMKKMAKHNNGIMLLPASLETDDFYHYVHGRSAAILFLNGRPHFSYPTGERAKFNSGCTICLIAYGSENIQSLINSKLGVVYKQA